MRTARPEPSGFAAKARDLQALRDAVDQAATVSGALWLSYIFVFFYLAIAVGAVTHKDLFFENPVKLPFLNVELPLISFSVLGPLLFLIVHAYTLLHFAMLAGKVGEFHKELEAQIRHEETRARLRRQLPSNIFVQFLAGPREVRFGVMGFILRLIAWISLMIGPVALLVFFELQFLPYHSPEVTWWHRIAVLIDVILLWMLWPRVAPVTATSALGRYYRVGLRGVGLTGITLLSLLLVVVATFRGEWVHNVLPPGPRFVPTSFAKIKWEWLDKIRREGFRDIPWADTEPVTPYELLVGGEVDPVSRRPKSWWSNRLVLVGVDLRDSPQFDTEMKIASRGTTISMRKRRLEDAVLYGAYLPKADFNGAYLQGALLDSAQLQGAFLIGAQLQGASLRKTQLQGALLVLAQLQGAEMTEAQLQGAVLGGTQLQGTALSGAQLQGAALGQAQLQGAALREAQLQGATLYRTQLQGARLGGAQLQGAALYNVFIWRAEAPEIKDAAIADIDSLVTDRKYRNLDCVQYVACDWSADSYTNLRQLIIDMVPAGDRRNGALVGIWNLDPREELEWQSERWTELLKNRPTQDEYRTNLVEVLRNIGCEGSGAPYVVKILSLQIEDRFRNDPIRAKKLADAFLDANCIGARGLSEDDKQELRNIRNRARSQSLEEKAATEK